MTIDVRVLGPDDEGLLHSVAPDVFDNAVESRLVSEFLRDRNHHLVVALDAGAIVGFASGVTYAHPDKPIELWVNEIGVAPSHQKQGLGARLLRALFEVGRGVGCREAWVLTDRENAAAMRLYESVGGAEAPEETVMYSFSLDASQ